MGKKYLDGEKSFFPFVFLPEEAPTKQ